MVSRLLVLRHFCPIAFLNILLPSPSWACTMSGITLQLQAAARSAYRNLYRASASTFAGDNEILFAFRQKMRADALQYKDQTDPKAYEESVKLGNEVATILRRNFVQAQRVASDEDQKWKIRITEHTELGDNDSIKNPPAMPTRGKGRRVKCCSE